MGCRIGAFGRGDDRRDAGGTAPTPLRMLQRILNFDLEQLGQRDTKVQHSQNRDTAEIRVKP